MSSEVTTTDLTRVIASAYARRTHKARHRRPTSNDRRAGIGVLVLLATGAAGSAGLLMHLIGWW